MDQRLSAAMLGGFMGLALVVLVAVVRPASRSPAALGQAGVAGEGPSVSLPPSMEPGDIYDAYAAPGAASSLGEAAQLSVVDAGTLVLPSGRVTASDVYLFDQPALGRSLPPGRYPVLLLRAEYAEGDAVAAAMLRVGPGDPVTWEPATGTGVDPSTVDPATFGSYGVDSGIAAFFAAEAADRLHATDEAGWAAYGEHVTQSLFPSEGEHRLSAEVFVDPTTGANAIAFSSGFGDGGYPAWFGLDEDGWPLVLLTEFGILEAPAT